MGKIGNQQMLREINKSLLLHLIYQHGPVSRIELSRQTKLSPSTVSILVEEALREGIIYETGTSGSGVGRRVTLLNIKADSGYVLGLDLAGAQCVLLNMRGEIKSSHTIPRLIGETAIRQELVGIVDDFLDSCPISRDQLRRIGVSVPGRVDETSQKVLRAIPLQLEEMNLGGFLEMTYQVPVSLFNDLDAAGFAERFNGVAQGLSTLVYILIDYGVGAGIVINDKIYRGSSGGAGRIRVFSPYCTERLALRLRQEHPEVFSDQGLTSKEVLHKFMEDGMRTEGPLHKELGALVDHLSAYCGAILQFINPEQLILNGWITENQAFFDRLTAKIREHEANIFERPTPIKPASWKELGAAVGAATLGLHHIFKMKMVD
ncbi:ROK family transcriptional regulator [Paenibacillus tuaregi]|uniref:ROK family transcriptional regulator n=1 Tax=Paenibacillus tuaregi TaxID=1816681 RepID=UPI0008396DED|nr:ROK family transcriptional regulator [Paenibacillus tuaregi]